MVSREAPRGFELFKNKQDDCNKVVLSPWQDSINDGPVA